MEATYHRELNETWMILDGEGECEEFALRILQENRLEGLMPVSIRRSDGETKYCFEISRGKSLARILEKRSVTVREIRQILFALDQVIGRMEEYLLDLDHLILEPELIYGAPDISHMLFCCHPAARRDFFDQLRDLIQYFLNKTDHLEENGVEMVYALFQVCQQEYFRFDDLLAVVGQERTEEKRVVEAAEPERDAKEEEKDLRELRSEQEAPAEEKERAHFRVLPVFTGAAGALLLALCLFRKINGEVFEVKWILGGGLLLFLTAVVAFTGRKRGERREPQTIPENPRRERTPLEEKTARPERSACSEDTGVKRQRVDSGRRVLPQERDRTEVLSGNFRLLTRERVLISENSLRYESIRIAKMPFVIGKLADVSDFTLQRATVSRIHARLEQQGKDFFLTDCNSTNGTYINGIRLEPNRRYPLQEGDEVGFADLKYVFQ